MIRRCRRRVRHLCSCMGHGAWCWRRVADRLNARGRYVVAPTLSGVCERSHVASDLINLSTHIDDVVLYSCSCVPIRELHAALDRCRMDRTWKTIEMKCGHDIMIDQPAELAVILEQLG